MKNKILLLILILPCLLWAQDVAVTATVTNNRVYEGTTFHLIIEARGTNFGSIQNAEFPDPFPFAILSNPSRSTGSSTTVSNFQMTTQKTESLTYPIRADRVGTHTILPITVTIDGRVYATRPIEVSVFERTGQQQAGQQGQQNQQQRPQQQTIPGMSGQQQITQDGSETFILATVDRTTVYRNEMVIVHYKLYTQSNVRQIQLGTEPSFADFWKEDLYQPNTISWQRENYDGRPYNTFVIRSLALFPSREGTLSIPRMELNIEILMLGRGLFGFSTPQQINVRSNPVTIRVNPLPAATPGADYIGAVGRFEITSSLSANEGETGESLTYRVVVSGTGNFNQISAPRLPNVRGIRFMTPEVNDRKNQSSSNFSGSRTFIYPVLLQESGTFTIPAREVTWFDTQSRRYQTKTFPAETIQVRQSEQHQMVVGGSQPITRRTGHDIQFIVTSLSARSFSFFYQTFWYWLIVVLLSLSLIGHNFYLLEMKRQNADSHYRRDRRAYSIMRKYLKEATKYAAANSIEFYNSAYMGMTLFLTDKLKIARGSAEKTIYEALSERNVDAVLIKELQACFDKINFIKFSSASVDAVNISEDIETIKNLINSLVIEISKKRGKNK